MDYIHHYLAKQPKKKRGIITEKPCRNWNAQNNVPSLEYPVNACMTIPVGTASVERNFSQMKMIKSRLRNCLGEKSLSYLMKIVIKSQQKLSDDDLETIIGVWTRKYRKIVV